MAALALAACAHSAQKVDIREPMIVTAAPPALAPLADLDAATLFDKGTRSFKDGDFTQAAQAFDRLWQAFPDSPQAPQALWNAALSYERLARYDESLRRLTAYLAVHDEPEAQFHAAYAEYQLHRLDSAVARLEALRRRSDLKPRLRVEALLQEGVCKIESGARVPGEDLVREAVAEAGKLDDPEPALLAEADFWLGEGERTGFLAIAIDPSRMDEAKLQEAIETKSRFLLSAEDHYLHAIRRGDGEWATAAGFRIGEMYEAFYGELVQAPLPNGLTQEQRALYSQELRAKVRRLVDKAIRIYEETLQQGGKGAYRAKTQDALSRLRKLLLETS
ncbi:MAG TPA: tetratricopeptide repeat protein [Myxococcales bacterium]